jgi:hypothetical protein
VTVTDIRLGTVCRIRDLGRYSRETLEKLT